MKRRLEALCNGASKSAQALFPGIRPSVSRWAMWAIAVSWTAVVVIALWDRATHGQNIDQPGEWNSAMFALAAMTGVFVFAPCCCFRPSEAPFASAKEVFWLLLTFPWTMLACWIITNRLSIPMPEDWWEIYQEDNARSRLVLEVLILLSVAVGIAAVVTSYGFPSLGGSEPFADDNAGGVPPPYSAWDAVRPSNLAPPTPHSRQSRVGPTGSTRMSGSERKHPTPAQSSAPGGQDLAIRPNC